MNFEEICREIDKKFKDAESLGVEKIIETEKAWILTRKEKDSSAVYGNYAAVIFKEAQNEALLLTPELYAEVGKTIKETNYKAS